MNSKIILILLSLGYANGLEIKSGKSEETNSDEPQLAPPQVELDDDDLFIALLEAKDEEKESELSKLGCPPSKEKHMKGLCAMISETGFGSCKKIAAATYASYNKPVRSKETPGPAVLVGSDMPERWTGSLPKFPHFPYWDAMTDEYWESYTDKYTKDLQQYIKKGSYKLCKKIGTEIYNLCKKQYTEFVNQDSKWLEAGEPEEKTHCEQAIFCGAFLETETWEKIPSMLPEWNPGYLIDEAKTHTGLFLYDVDLETDATYPLYEDQTEGLVTAKQANMNVLKQDTFRTCLAFHDCEKNMEAFFLSEAGFDSDESQNPDFVLGPNCENGDEEVVSGGPAHDILADMTDLEMDDLGDWFCLCENRLDAHCVSKSQLGETLDYTEPRNIQGDGRCDRECMTSKCYYDNGDCGDTQSEFYMCYDWFVSSYADSRLQIWPTMDEYAQKIALTDNMANMRQSQMTNENDIPYGGPWYDQKMFFSNALACWGHWGTSELYECWNPKTLTSDAMIAGYESRKKGDVDIYFCEIGTHPFDNNKCVDFETGFLTNAFAEKLGSLGDLPLSDPNLERVLNQNSKLHQWHDLEHKCPLQMNMYKVDEKTVDFSMCKGYMTIDEFPVFWDCFEKKKELIWSNIITGDKKGVNKEDFWIYIELKIREAVAEQNAAGTKGSYLYVKPGDSETLKYALDACFPVGDADGDGLLEFHEFDHSMYCLQMMDFATLINKYEYPKFILGTYESAVMCQQFRNIGWELMNLDKQEPEYKWLYSTIRDTMSNVHSFDGSCCPPNLEHQISYWGGTACVCVYASDPCCGSTNFCDEWN